MQTVQYSPRPAVFCEFAQEWAFARVWEGDLFCQFCGEDHWV